MTKYRIQALWSLLAILTYFLVMQIAFGQDEKGVALMASSVTGSFTAIGKLMVAAAYVAGFALTIAAIFKFKAHRDNPQQVPMGLPIALLAIGVVLVFLPSLFTPAGESVFGGGQEAGGFTGGGATSVEGKT